MPVISVMLYVYITKAFVQNKCFILLIIIMNISHRRRAEMKLHGLRLRPLKYSNKEIFLAQQSIWNTSTKKFYPKICRPPEEQYNIIMRLNILAGRKSMKTDL